MSKVLRNFRGLRAVVLQGDASGRNTLLLTLEKLGLEAETIEPSQVRREAIATADLIFVDADEGIEPILQGNELPDVPLIAIIGNEAPSRLTRVVRARAASHIQKPIRSSGIFTAVLLGFNEHNKRRQQEKQIAALRRRLSGRRVVVKAVLALMRRWGIDEDAAYQILRSDAMRDRIPVEDAASRLLAGPPDDPSAQYHAGSRE
ncbi:ANTAR domain-containing response regulator [Roseobacter sp.]|uniref:ANTAR domain-containing response regulator n=1 Tax=Roseobacter sp. TaxID=1907202 RepID=UPI003858BB07